MSRSQSHVISREQTGVRIQKQEQSTTRTSSYDPKPEYAKRGPQTRARANPTSTGGVTLDQRHEAALRCPVNKSRFGVQGCRSELEPSIGARQVGVTSELSIKPVNRRVKKDQDVPKTRNSQPHREKSNSDARTEKRIMQVLLSRAVAKRESASGMLNENAPESSYRKNT